MSAMSPPPAPGNPGISAEPFSSTGHGARAKVGVVMSHGFTGSPHSMRGWASELANAGFSVELPLLPGHGTSWQDMATRSWQEWYRAYSDSYDALAERTDVIVAAGLSMGGALALRLSALRPVAGTVVVNPALVVDDWRAPFAGIFKHAVKSTPSIANDILKPGVDEGAYSRTPTAAAHELYKLLANTRELLPRISHPVKVYRSTADHIVGDSSMVALSAGLRQGLLDVVPLDNSYHVATMDFDAPLIFQDSIKVISTLTGTRA